MEIEQKDQHPASNAKKFFNQNYHPLTEFCLKDELGVPTKLANANCPSTQMKVRRRWKIENHSLTCMTWIDKANSLVLGSTNNGRLISISDAVLNKGADTCDIVSLTPVTSYWSVNECSVIICDETGASDVLAVDSHNGRLVFCGRAKNDQINLRWLQAWKNLSTARTDFDTARWKYNIDYQSCSMFYNCESRRFVASGRRAGIYADEKLGRPYRFDSKSDIQSVSVVTGPERRGFYLGCRDGTVLHYDLRLDSNRLHKTTGFCLPSAVKHVKCLNDDKYLIVSCLNGEIMMYDWRFVKKKLTERSLAPLPVMNYTGFIATHEINDGFDIVDSGISSFMAAGNKKCLNIYDVTQASPIVKYSQPINSTIEHNFGVIKALKWTYNLGLFVLSDDSYVSYLSTRNLVTNARLGQHSSF